MWIEELSFLDVCVRIEIWIYQISNPLEYLLSLRVTYPLSLTVIKVILRSIITYCYDHFQDPDNARAAPYMLKIH